MIATLTMRLLMLMLLLMKLLLYVQLLVLVNVAGLDSELLDLTIDPNRGLEQSEVQQRDVI